MTKLPIQPERSAYDAPRRRRAVALVELLLALAITAMIGSAVAAMMLAMRQGTEFRRETVNAAVMLHLADARLGEAIRTSYMVLDAGPDYIVLWKGDALGNGWPNRKEIQRIERDSNTNTMRSYAASPAAPPLWNIEYNPSTTDFNAVTLALRTDPNMIEQIWSRHVSAWTMTLDDADPHAARLVSYRLTVTRPAGDVGGGSSGTDTSETRTTTAALRNRD